MRTWALAALLVATLAGVGPSRAGSYEDELLALARARIAAVLSAEVVIEAVRAQNAVSAGLSQAEIDALDRRWRRETESADQSLIDEVMERRVSLFLAEVQDGSEGPFTEIFVTDLRGLNVGQSVVTSDLWQADELKWQAVIAGGPDGVHVGPPEADASTQRSQQQIGAPVLDPQTRAVIGVGIFGIRVGMP